MKRILSCLVAIVLVGSSCNGKVLSGPFPKPTTTTSSTTTTVVPTTTVSLPGTTTTTTIKPVPTSTTTSTTTTVPSQTVSVTSYGAVANDGVDDQAAIQRALNEAPVGYTLVFPAGVYTHSSSLKVTRNNLTLLGPGTLRGTNPDDQALIIKGSNVTVDGLSVNNIVNGRKGAEEQMGISVSFSSGTTVRNVTVDTTSSAGIFIWGANNYSIVNNVVRNTLSDGIHNTGSAYNGLVQGNTLTNIGDDCFAVVSYGTDSVPVHDVVVRNNSCDTGKARGASVVGGENITIQGNTLTKTAAAGIYVASESSYNTLAVKNVDIIGNIVIQCNTNAAINHGGIFMWAQPGKPNVDILLQENVIRDTVVGAANIVSQTDLTKDLRLVGNKTYGSKPHVYMESSYTMVGDSHNDVALSNK